jgi:hypothetical protein
MIGWIKNRMERRRKKKIGSREKRSPIIVIKVRRSIDDNAFVTKPLIGQPLLDTESGAGGMQAGGVHCPIHVSVFLKTVKQHRLSSLRTNTQSPNLTCTAGVEILGLLLRYWMHLLREWKSKKVSQSSSNIFSLSSSSSLCLSLSLCLFLHLVSPPAPSGTSLR